MSIFPRAVSKKTHVSLIFIIATAIIFSLFGVFWVTWRASAGGLPPRGANTAVYVNSPTTLSPGDSGLFGIIMTGTDDNGKTITSIKMNFTGTAGTPTWTQGTANSSDLAALSADGAGGIFLMQDDGDGQPEAPGPGSDTLITLTSPVYGAANTLTLTLVTPLSTTGATLWVCYKISDAPVPGNAFTITFPADSITMSGGSPTVTPATTGAFTIGDGGAATTVKSLLTSPSKAKGDVTVNNLLRIDFGTNEAGKTLNGVKVVFGGSSGSPTWTQGAVTSSVLKNLATTNGGVGLYKDTTGDGTCTAGVDTQITLASNPLYSAANVFTLLPATPPTIVAGDKYCVVLLTKQNPMDGQVFSVNLPADGVITSSTSPTVTSTTTANITIDTIAPQIISSIPTNASTGVATNIAMSATMNEAPAADKITTSNILLKANDGNTQGGTPSGSNLCTSVSLNGNKIICSHDALSNSTWYTLTLTTQIADQAYNPIPADFNAVFQTIGASTITKNQMGGATGIKASGTKNPFLVAFGTDEAGKTLTSVTVSFTSVAGSSSWAQGAITSSDLKDLSTDPTLSGIALYKDADGNDSSDPTIDTAITLASNPVYGAANAFTLTPATPPTLAAGDKYLVVIRGKATPVNGNAFTMTLGADGIVTSSSSPTVTARTTPTITVDTVAPTMSSSSPANGATGVATGATIAVTPFETLRAQSVTTTNVTLKVHSPNEQGGTPGGSNLCTSATYTTTVNCVHSALSGSTWYTLTLTTGVQDLAQNGMASNYTVVFQTVAADVTPPTMLSSSPANGATGVAVDAIITVNPSEALLAPTVTTTNVTLKVNSPNTQVGTPTGSNLCASVNFVPTTINFTCGHTSNLSGSTWYTLTVTTGVQDSAGNPLASNYVVVFQTAAIPTTVVSGVTSPLVKGGGGSITYLFKVTFGGAENAKTFNGMTVSFTGVSGSPTWTEGSAVSSTFNDLGALGGGVALYKDNGNGTWSFADDTIVTLAANPVYSAGNAFTMIPATPPTIATGDVYYVIVFPKSTPVDGQAFTATVPADGIITSSTSPTVTVATTSTITMDAILPTMTSSSPANGATNVASDATITVTPSESLLTSFVNTANVILKVHNPNTQGGALDGANLCSSATYTTVIGCTHAVLSELTWYTLTVMTGVKDSAWNSLASNYVVVFRTRSSDITAPTVTGVGGPQNGMQGVTPEVWIDRGFSEPLAAATVTTSSVLLQTNTGNTQGGAPAGENKCTSVELRENATRVLCNHNALTVNTWYTFKITTAVTDVVGNPLATNFTASFMVSSFGGGSEFNPPPMIFGSSPASGQSLPTNGKIMLNFSRPMAQDGAGSVLSITNVKLYATTNNNPTGNNLFTSTNGWSWNSTSNVLLIPLPTLTVGNTYRLMVMAENGNPSCTACAKSTDGLPLMGQNFIVDFTASAVDNTAPTVSGSLPASGATGVDRALYDYSVSFSEALNPATVSTTTVKLYCNDADSTASNGCTGTNTNTVDGTDVDLSATSQAPILDPDGRTVHVSLGATLPQASDNYYIRIVSGSSGVKDMVGNAIGADVIVPFRFGSNVNGAASDSAGPRVLFANADNFGIFITLSEAVLSDVSSNATQTTSSGTNDVNNASNWTIETTGDNVNYSTISLLGKKVFYEGYSATLQIEGLMMPPNQRFRVTGSTAIHDMAGNDLDGSYLTASGTVGSAGNTGGNLGPNSGGGQVDYFTRASDPIDVFPMTGLAGANTRYRVQFRAPTAIPGTGKITLTYPSGFSFGGTCTTLPTDTFENQDINGQSTGTVTISSVACDSVARTVTLTLGATGVVANDRLQFVIQGVINSTIAKEPGTTGYTVGIKTYNASNLLLDSLTSMAFFLNAGGSRSVSGRLFVDNGAGGGTAGNGVQDGSEAGASGISVCLGGPMGFSCANTDASGDYSFGSLSNGSYRLDIPPITSGSLTGGPFYRDIFVNNASVTGENFPLTSASAGNTLDVYISGGAGLAGTKLDVFAFSSAGGTVGPQMGGGGAGGSVAREVTLDGSGIGEVDLPLTAGRWEIGVGPWMPKTPGTAMSVPDFNFMPPQPRQVEVGNSGVPDLCTSGGGASTNELCFTLTSTSSQILGKVVDASGAAIANAFIMARPSVMDGSGGGSEMGFATVAQSNSTGNFILKTLTGTFMVEASVPGMPFGTPAECTVKANTGASDSNSTADVYCESILIINDVTGFSSASLTPSAVTSNDLVFTIAKGNTSISGSVLDDGGNAITNAGVTAQEVDGSNNPIGKFVDSMTDSTGSYTLYVDGGTTEAPKNWRACAFAPGYGQLPCQTVAVVNGTNVTGKNFQPVSANFVTVTGTVYIDTDGDSLVDSGEGVSGAHVNIYGSGGSNGGASGSDGSYSIKVTAGTGYNIEAFVPGQGPTERLTNQNLSESASGKNLRMTQPGTLMVLVCTPVNASDLSLGCASRQVTNAFVDARKSDGFGNGTTSNTTPGVYELVVPSGTYTVRANNDKIGPIGTSSNVVVTGSGTTYVNIAPPVTVTVSGTVSSSAAACVEGATVSLMQSLNGRMMLASVAVDGTWSLSGVPSGTYDVIAMKPGCVDAAAKGAVVVGSTNLTQVGDTDLARTMTVTDATVSGHVFVDADSDATFDSGENVTYEAVVFASTAAGKAVITPVDISKSGTDVNYTLNLVPGTWTIKARSDGSESTIATVVVATGNNLTQNLALTAIAGYTRREPRTSAIAPSRGGLIKNTEIGNNFELNIPAGALGTSTSDGSIITKETTAVANTNTQTVIGGKGISITPKNSSGQPITTLSTSNGGAPTITIPYTAADVTAAVGTESNIIIGAWSEEKQQWEPQSTTCDTVNDTCTATVEHFSTFATIATVATTAATNTNTGSTNTSGAGGAYVAPATMTITAPNGGEQLSAGGTKEIKWTSNGSGISKIRIMLSSDGGLGFQTTVATNESNDGTYTWTVPQLTGSKFRIKVEGLSSAGVVMISDLSDSNFSIGPGGAVPTPTPSTDASDIPGVTSGSSYDKTLALGASATINDDLALVSSAGGGAVPAACESNTLIKGQSFAAVYYCGADGQRYVFPNDKIYGTWYDGFDDVTVISDTALASIRLGGVVKYHPGSRMIKIESDPRVYAVAPGGLLRWVASEAVATSLYGAEWNQWIDDIPVSFFGQYSFGSDITE